MARINHFMPLPIRLHVAQKLLDWSRRIERVAARPELGRSSRTLLIFFHGYSLAHTLRPLVIARALRERGYSIVLAGRGPHKDRIRREGFVVHDVETMPQSRMDRYVESGDYAYYDQEWIHRCVVSERELIQATNPDLIIHDLKPTASLSARLEGVDEARITQAYNQPAYPNSIRLIDSFNTESGPFARYLACHANQVKRQRNFYLLADIPEFHPPGREGGGYYYVGPLLDQPALPKTVAILDEGWDTSLPLVYLTCGSSGRAPDYLADLLDILKDRPYRILVTTAGRWPGEAPAPNVRVVDFVPGEWVLRQASVLVGIVGIGAIYQALRYSVPVVGAPEHLDQEYHLNRIRDLGLGIKLDRRDFEAEKILEAIDSVLANSEQYRLRCAPLATALQKWQGGERVADIVDSHFATDTEDYRAESGYLVPEQEFAEYLEVSSPLSGECVKEILRDALDRGIPHRREAGQLYYDQIDSWNWLYDSEPRFFECDYRVLEAKRRRAFASGANAIKMHEEWQRYRVEYTLSIQPGSFAPGQHVRFNLPFPIPRANHQRDVELIEYRPGEMGESLAFTLGYFYGYEFVAQAGDGVRELSYVCELSVRALEQGAGLGPAPLDEEERIQYTQFDESLLEYPEVVCARAQWSEIDDMEQKARAIYDSIARRKRFKKTRDRTQGFVYSTLAVLNDTGGHCTTLTRAFISLCRAEGIPAREVAGALIGYPVGEGRFCMQGRNEGLYGHVWAEIYLRDRGWIPVEFHGVVIGPQAMTDKNVVDPQLRAAVEEKGPQYIDYYFGHLDNQRLLFSSSVKSMPLCQVEDADVPPASAQRWRWPEHMRFNTRLEVECL